ncbi:Endonuclease/exonuclease/phosphatase [Pelagophyceae sp. CCMP2097]|nr:Endonuclease/exonuclease/phosphatase [Pelagophyceae sp. CCMP2097]|mmetsp:Transcript_6472/g.20787  ORF Transcript_6472/g.20787 Transcript_6472/m.20787 type:complete len:546 (+) Transcript_6472:140-1777(+)
MQGSLSVNVARPVSGCSLRPQVKMQRAANWPADLEVEYRWRWLRGSQRIPNCAAPGCRSAHDYDPVASARRGSGLLCAPCLKAQQPLESLTFCSARCFVDAWPCHRDKHRGSRPRSQSDVYDTEAVHGAAYKTDKDWSEDNEAQWEVVAEHTNEFTPSEGDVGRRLRVECYAVKAGTSDLLGRGFKKTGVVLAAPEAPVPRPLAPAPQYSSAPRADVRVVSYNVLAEIYATQHAYPYCERWALDWQYRVRTVVHELVASDADVLCLQEAQRDHYERDLEPALRARGYEGYFTQKSRESMGAAGKVDGCAVFWKARKWRLSEQRSVCFNDLAMRSAQNLGLSGHDEHAFLTRLVKDNVAQFVVLDALDVRGRRVCVANTHLYSHKDFPDTKLWQTLALLRSLEAFVNGRPLILAGDFNSGPESSVYELLATQAVDPRRPEVQFADARRPGGALKILPDARNITHRLHLASAYFAVQGKEPAFTNLTRTFQGTLDYIWYDPRALQCTAVAPIPDVSELTHAGVALPNARHPSDHVMLVSDFIITAKQ